MPDTSIPKRKLKSIFFKKSHKRKSENNLKKNKKSRKKQLSASNIMKELGNETFATLDEGMNSDHESDAKILKKTKANQPAAGAKAFEEKENPKNLRRRMPFSRRQSKRFKKVTFAESRALEDVGQVTIEEGQESSVFEGETKQDAKSSNPKQKTEEAKEESEYYGTATEAAEQESLTLDVLEMMTPSHDVFFSDNDPQFTGTKPEIQLQTGTSENGIPWTQLVLTEILSPLKDLMPYAANKPLTSYEMCLSVLDYSIAKLLGFCSCVVNQAGYTSRQVLFHLVLSLVKRYPHCFQVQIKKKKRRRNDKAKQEQRECTEEKETFAC